MGTGQHVRALLKRWKLILLCTLVLGSGAYLGSELIVPRYQATAIIEIMTHPEHSSMDINTVLASGQLVQTQAQLAISLPVLREVASHYPDMTIERLATDISVNPKAGTQLFSIDVLDQDPWRAAALANDVATTLIKQQIELIQQNKSISQKQIQQDIKQTRQQIDVTEKQRSRLQGTPKSDFDVRALDAKAEDLHLHYNQLQLLLTQLELAEAQGNTLLRIAQSAQPATSPVQPDITVNTALGSLLGLLVGLLLAQLFELLDPRIRSEEALMRLVDWPVLATIWREKQKNSKKHAGKNNELLLPEEHSANIEAYRLLRTNISLIQTHKPLRSILLISATPQDGKSTVAANLAIFIAKAGKKTLLIDADLRRPTQTRKFQLTGERKGLSSAIQYCSQEYLIASSTRPTHEQVRTNLSLPLTDYVYTTDIPALSIMPAGPLPANPPDVLDSQAMNLVLANLEASDFEMIIFDTPPLHGLADTTILLAKVDSVLIVLDITKTHKKNLKRMQTLLEQYGNQILGCVINKQKYNPKEVPYSYYRNQPVTKDDRSTSVLPEQEKADTKRKKSYAEVIVTTNTSRAAGVKGVTADKQIAEQDTLPVMATGDQQQEGYLTLEDGIHLYYKVIGNRPETLIIPAASWLAADLEALAKEYTLIFYDQRGRGRSAALIDTSKIGMQHDVSDLEAIRRHFKVTTCSLLGWSYLGGTTALYSMQHPKRVQCLILVAPMAVRYGEYADDRQLDPDKRLDPKAIQRLKEMLDAGMDKKEPGTYNREYIKATRLPRQMGKPAALAQMKSDPWVSSNEWPEALSNYFDQFAASMGEWDWRSMATTLEVPTLIIHGAEDLLPLAASKEWAETLPNSQLLIIPGVGHYPWLESPEIFLPAIANFIRATSSQKVVPVQKVAIQQRRRSKG
ncbi:hypothetical protein KDA_65740 [Dictyobacter alpinus]|uniref:AAA domain-containing protein n=1 Tax=Dictyobacter alpinus TaxID=2014873 RepID=A0A402BIC8_9CHLR|nr:alpha/beta fold hydrolase [Dictyobacter alpinus]GCE31090.1 hypothetical protein KDA_65740 [Dictyobacter alpinus]